MRDFITDDLFLLVDVVEALNVEDIINAIGKLDTEDYKNEKGELDEEKWGMAIIKAIGGLLLKNMGKCKKPLYAFLASLKGCKVEDIGKQPITQTFSDVRELVEKAGFKDLFSQASELTK